MQITFIKYLPLVYLLLFISTGCSSLQIKHHSLGAQPPVCHDYPEKTKIAVFWDTAWRQNQKEPAIREALIAEGLNNFFTHSRCYQLLAVSRKIDGRSVLLSPESELLSAARSSGAEKAIIISIEELGPNLMLYLSPILWQTKNEVSLRVKVIDVRAGNVEVNLATQWLRGGPFMLLGANSLHRDINGILAAIFSAQGNKYGNLEK